MNTQPPWWPPQVGDVVLVPIPEDEHHVVRVREMSGWYPPGNGSLSRFTDNDMLGAALLVRDETVYQPQWLAA